MSDIIHDRRPAYVRAVVEAAGWRSQLTERGLQSSSGFENWLAADPLHRQAWEETQSTWDFVGELAASPEMISARQAALARAQRHASTSRHWSVRRIVAAIVVAVALLAAGGGGVVWLQAMPDTYRTALGERRVIPLSDGSKVSLDSGSRLRVRYTAQRRDLTLLAGQARFDVAHDTSRPFVVVARDRAITATGTAFNVDLIGPRVVVTLIEGRVLVRRVPQATETAAAEGAVVLAAGQQLAALPAAPPHIAPVSLDRATAWESGQLIFDNEPIEDVVTRVSRYADARISVDPAARDLRVSGVFKAGDLKTFLDAVTSYLPIEAEPTPDGGTILRKK